MLNREVIVGRYYTAKIGGVQTVVHLTAVNSHGGFHATNLKSGREIFLKTAGKLRSMISPNTLTAIVGVYCPNHILARIGPKNATEIRTVEKVAETSSAKSESACIVGVLDCGTDYVARTFGEF